MHAHIQGLLFDLDGTLVDTTIAHIRAWIEACKIMGIPADEAEVMRLLGRTSLEIAHALLVTHQKEDLAPQLASLKDSLFEEKYVSLIKAFPEVESVLLFLKRSSIKVAILSSNPRSLIMRVLSQTGLIGLVDVVVGQDEVRKGKPSPEPVFLALQRLDLAPQQVVMVGDSIYDIIAARRAHVVPIGVTTGVHSAEELLAAGAIFVLRKLSELGTCLRLLENIHRPSSP